MNHFEQKIANQDILSSFIDFLPHCEEIGEKMSLLDHIQEIREQIKTVEVMTVSEASNEVTYVEEEFPSLINFQYD